MLIQEYAVMPDGTIFPLKCPDDFVEARQIIRDELGNGFGRDGWQGPVSQPEAQVIHCA